uniref:Abhydrolase domain containing 12B n=1 Tax=Mus musculus TaxID=10090 RepID=S4R1Y3_MOUSE
MDARDCDAASEPGPPPCSSVTSWWAMVLRNLSYGSHSRGFKETRDKDCSHSELLPQA